MGATGENIKPTDKGLSNKFRYWLEMGMWKKERINFHRERMNELLAMEEPPEDIDWEEILEDHQIKTAQFQHERHMHLLVTLTFAIMSMVVGTGAAFLRSQILAILSVLLVGTLAPYCFYYFMLENNVQAMYPIYDEIWERVLKQRKEMRICNGKNTTACHEATGNRQG